jgi:hypothetical protein
MGSPLDSSKNIAACAYFLNFSMCFRIENVVRQALIALYLIAIAHKKSQPPQ